MKTEIKWGMIIAVAGFVWLCLEFLFGLHTTRIDLHPIVTMLWIPVAIVLLVLALREKKRMNGGQLTYLQGLTATGVIAVIVLVLSPCAQWLFHTFVNPGFFDAMIEHSASRAAEQDLTPEAAREKAEAAFNLRSYLTQAALAGGVGTLVTGAIAMVFLKSQ